MRKINNLKNIFICLLSSALFVSTALSYDNACFAADLSSPDTTDTATDTNINGSLIQPQQVIDISPDVPLSQEDIFNAVSTPDEIINQKDSDAGVPEEINTKKINKGKLPDYNIKVNLKTNTVTIYRKSETGEYVPYRAMVCSIGRRGHETPEGTYKTSDYYTWRLMVDNTYGRYAVRFNHGIMFHSVPYFDTTKDSLEWQEYNKLGSPASLGCIRLAVADAKWIFDNCKRGTTVIVYTGNADTDPLGTPEPIKIPVRAKHRDWDPTDLTSENPWLIPVE